MLYAFEKVNSNYYLLVCVIIINVKFIVDKFPKYLTRSPIFYGFHKYVRRWKFLSGHWPLPLVI